MSEGGGGGADVSAMTTPSTIVIEETDGSRLRAGGDDIANLAVLAQLGFGGLSPRDRHENNAGTQSTGTTAIGNRAQVSAFSSPKHKQSRRRRRRVA
jgi:hypothetical protein